MPILYDIIHVLCINVTVVYQVYKGALAPSPIKHLQIYIFFKSLFSIENLKRKKHNIIQYISIYFTQLANNY